MNEPPLTITDAHTLDGSQVMVTLSDGRILAVTLLEILSIETDSAPPDDDEEGERG